MTETAENGEISRREVVIEVGTADEEGKYKAIKFKEAGGMCEVSVEFPDGTASFAELSDENRSALLELLKPQN